MTTQQKPLQQRANEHYASRFDEERCELIERARQGDGDAIEEIEETPLGIGKLITDHRNEEVQWEILLGTGGPADRVLVTTNFSGSVIRADYQHQDWFEPWTTAENQEQDVLTSYAELFYYEPEDEAA